VSTVAFATYEDTTDPTKSSGFSGFPFPAKLNEHVGSLYHPKGVSFTTAIDWWWKVKTWTFETDIGTITLSPRYSPFTAVTELQYPVTPSAPQTYWEGTIGSGTDYDDVTFIIYAQSSPPPWALSQDGAGLFFPFIVITVTGNRFGFAGYVIESFNAASIGTVPVTLAGETFNINQQSGITNCGFITISPASYWTY